jgi:hypothetical protein
MGSVYFLEQATRAKVDGLRMGSRSWIEGIIIYKRTSHSSNIKTLKYCASWRLLLIVDLALKIASETLN